MSDTADSPTTAVDHVRPNAPAHSEGEVIVPSGSGVSQEEANRMWKVATMLANTNLVAKPLQGKPDSIMGVGLHLTALGLPFSLVGLKQVHVWEDNKGVQMQLHYQAHLALMARAGHDAWLAELTDDHATVKVIRCDTGREQTFTYTIAMARRAGLLNKDNWQKHPHYMLPARAAVMATRFACPDALIGLDDSATTTVLPVAPAQIPAAPAMSQAEGGPYAALEAGVAQVEAPSPSPAPPSSDVPDRPLPPEAESAEELAGFDHRRRHVNAAMAKAGIKGDDKRHEFLRYVTDGRVSSSARLTLQDSMAIVAAAEALADEGDPGPVEP